MGGELTELMPLPAVVLIEEAMGIDPEDERAVVTDPAVQAASGGAGGAEGGADFFPVVVDVALEHLHGFRGQDGDRARERQGGVHPDKTLPMAQ